MTHRFRHGLGLVATAAVLTTASLAASAGTNLIVNGDFADTNSTWHDNTGMGGDDMQLGGTMPPGWTGVPGRANDIWVGPSNAYGLTASPGNGSGYFLDLTGQKNEQPFGGVEQVIATTPGALYAISFDIGYSSLYNGPVPARSGIEVAAVGSTTQSSSEQIVPGSQTNGWLTFGSFEFVADAASTTVEFLSAADPQAEYAGLDNVSMTLLSSPPIAPIPEPAEMAMLLAGLGMVGVAARSRAQPKANIVSA